MHEEVLLQFYILQDSANLEDSPVRMITDINGTELEYSNALLVDTPRPWMLRIPWIKNGEEKVFCVIGPNCYLRSLWRALVEYHTHTHRDYKITGRVGYSAHFFVVDKKYACGDFYKLTKRELRLSYNFLKNRSLLHGYFHRRFGSCHEQIPVFV